MRKLVRSLWPLGSLLARCSGVARPEFASRIPDLGPALLPAGARSGLAVAYGPRSHARRIASGEAGLEVDPDPSYSRR